MLFSKEPRRPSDSLIRAGQSAWSIIGILLLMALGFYILYLLRVIIPPLVLALAIIFLLNPIISFLERRGVSRPIGTLGTYVVLFGTVFLGGALLTPPLRNQFSNFVEQLPQLQDRVVDMADRVAQRFGGQVDSETMRAWVSRYQKELRSGAEVLSRITFGVLHTVLVFVLAPIVAAYLLIDLPKLQGSAKSLIPDRYREEVTGLLEAAGNALGGFFRGQLVVAIIVGIMSSVGLLIIGLDFWLPIGLIAGFFNLIPLVGPFIGGALGVLVGLSTDGLKQAGLAALVFFVVQQVDNHFISPNIMGRAVKLHPVTVMMALLSGGTLAGFMGMLMAVPAVAVVKIFMVHYWTTRVTSPEAGRPEL